MTAYQVKPEPVPATTAGLTTAEITSIVTKLDPAALQDAGAAHSQLGRELNSVAAHLAQEAGTLAQNWSGVAARTALAQLQRLHQQTATLASQAAQTGAVLTRLGTQVLPAFQHPADPAQARQYLTQLTADLIRADAALPTHIGTPSASTSRPTIPASSPSQTASTHTSTNFSTINTKRTVSRPSPLSTSRSSQGNPAGTPLSGPAHPTSPVSSLQSAAPVPNPSPASGTTASLTPSPAPAPTPVPSPVTLASVPPGTSTTTATTPDPAATTNTDTAATPETQATPAASAATDAEASLPLASKVSTGTPSHTGDSGHVDDREAQPSPDSGLSGGALSVPVQPSGATAVHAISAIPVTPAPVTQSRHSFLPPVACVGTPPGQERHRQSWVTEDRNLWGLPADCVPPLIQGD